MLPEDISFLLARKSVTCGQNSAKTSCSSYNAAIFTSLPNNPYTVFSVNEIFGQFSNSSDITAASVNLNRIQWNGFEDFSWEMSYSDDFNMLLAGAFKRMDPLQCLDAYSVEFQSSTSNLYLVTAENVSNLDPTLPAVLYAVHVFTDVLPIANPNSWICSQFPRTKKSLCSDRFSSFRANISTWRPFGHEVDYCLTRAHPADHVDVSSSTVECKVQFDLSIALVVGIVNLVQVIVMCIMLSRVKETPLLTQGDAILSFLDDPDPATESMCLLEKVDVARFKTPTKKIQLESSSKKWLSSPKRFSGERKRWHSAVGKLRWIGFALP
jgi:hypothetical protein